MVSTSFMFLCALVRLRHKSGFQIVNDRNMVVDGVNYELTLAEVAARLQACQEEQLAKG